MNPHLEPIIVCTLADVTTGVLALSFFSRNEPGFMMPSTPNVLAGLAIFWGTAVIACWFFPDIDPDNPDTDVTTIPPPPLLDTMDA